MKNGKRVVPSCGKPSVSFPGRSVPKKISGTACIFGRKAYLCIRYKIVIITTLIQNLHKYLTEHGVKPSVQRIAVMEYLATHRTHPTADEIHTALHTTMPTLSKTTVYNTLRLLADHRAILSLDIDERNTRFDGDVSPHAHFRCRRCGCIRDLPAPEGHASAANIETDIEIDEVQWYYKGLCENCKQDSPIE